LANYVIRGIEENLLLASSTSKEINSKLSVLQAILFIAESWKDISQATLQNCFGRCGFATLPPEAVTIVDEIDHNPISDLATVSNYEEYRAIDSGVLCRDDNIDIEECTVEQVIGHRINNQMDSESENDEQCSEVSTREALNCIEKLQLFFMQEGNENSPQLHLDACLSFVRGRDIQVKKQSTIDKYLTKSN
jgi:hypothetical protein